MLLVQLIEVRFYHSLPFTRCCISVTVMHMTRVKHHKKSRSVHFFQYYCPLSVCVCRMDGAKDKEQEDRADNIEDTRGERDKTELMCVF